MAIELSPETERQVEEIVRTEQLSSADEFIRRCVERYGHEKNDRTSRWIKELAGREEIQRQVEEGARELEAGNYTEYDDEGLKAFFEQIKREGRQELGITVEDK